MQIRRDSQRKNVIASILNSSGKTPLKEQLDSTNNGGKLAHVAPRIICEADADDTLACSVKSFTSNHFRRYTSRGNGVFSHQKPSVSLRRCTAKSLERPSLRIRSRYTCTGFASQVRLTSRRNSNSPDDFTSIIAKLAPRSTKRASSAWRACST